MSQADDGDHWDVHQTNTGVVGLAIWCSSVGFCLGYWVVDAVPIRPAALCSGLIGVILGHCLARDHRPSGSRPW